MLLSLRQNHDCGHQLGSSSVLVDCRPRAPSWRRWTIFLFLLSESDGGWLHMDAACAGLAADTVVISATTARACSDIVLRLARRVHRVRMPCCPRGLAFLRMPCCPPGLALLRRRVRRAMGMRSRSLPGSPLAPGLRPACTIVGLAFMLTPFPMK